MVKRPAEHPPGEASASSSLSSSSSSSSSSSAPSPARKRAKFDEDEIDWLIGDLRKEEAQLILTRLTKDHGEEIRKQVDIVRHGREQYSADQVRQQVEFLAQLRQLQSTPTPFGTPKGFVGANMGLLTPMQGTPGFGFATPGMPAGKGPGISAARIKGIQSRIANAFKKDQHKQYKIQEDSVDEEVSKAKEYLSRSNHEDALKVMEAVTEEIVQRASSISGKVGNLREVMDWLGKEWIDMFLSSLFELQEDEKEDWFEKLRTWDTLFSDEESHFSCAKHAARHMWDNAKLQFILHGGHNETAAQRIAEGISSEQLKSEIQQLIGFKEPMNLIATRITWLEREKKIDQALNLSLALGMFENAAKFQIKLNNIEGAVQATDKIRDPGSLFSVAQVAKPVDVGFAFDLMIKAIVQAYLEQLVASSSSRGGGSGLSGRDTDLVLWTIGLAESSGRVDEFLERISKEIKSKDFVMGIFNLLSNKQKPLLALDLGEKVLPVYTLEELQEIFKELKNRAPQIKSSWENYESRLLEEQKASFLQHRSTILKFLPFCGSVKTLPNQMYQLLTGLLRQLAQKASENRNSSGGSDGSGGGSEGAAMLEKQQLELNDRVARLIDISLANAEDVQPLLLLIRSLSSDQRYDETYRVGKHILSLSKQYHEIEKAFQEKRTRDKFEFDELKQKELQERSGGGGQQQAAAAMNSATVFIEPIRDHPRCDYEKTNGDVFGILFDSGLISLRRFYEIPRSAGGAVGELAAGVSSSNGMMDVDETGSSETPEEKLEREKLKEQAMNVLREMASQVFSYIENPPTVVHLAGKLQSDCLQIGLGMLRGCFELNQKLRGISRKYEEVRENLSALEFEVQQLLSEKQKPSQEQLQTLRELRLSVCLQSIVPSFHKQTREAFESLTYRIGTTIVSFATTPTATSFSSTTTTSQQDVLTDSEIQRVLDLVLENVRSPKYLFDIAKSSLTNEPKYAIYFVDQVIPRLKGLHQKWMELGVLEVEQRILVEEQSVFQSKFKKDLDEVQLNRLDELQNLITLYTSETTDDGRAEQLPSYAIGKQASFFHDLQYQLVRLKLVSTVTHRNGLIGIIETPSIDRSVEQEERLQQDLLASQKTLKEAFETCLEQLTLPKHFVDLMNTFISQASLTLNQHIEYAESDVMLLLSLLDKATSQGSEEEEIEQIQLAKIDAKILEGEAQTLWDEVQSKQMVSVEQRDKLRRLKLQIGVFKQKFSGCDTPTLQNHSSVKKQMFRKESELVSSLTARLCGKYNAEYQVLEDLLVQAATENTPSLCARQSEELEKLRDLCGRSSQLLSSVVDLTLARVTGPGTVKGVIDSIARQIGDCNSSDLFEFGTGQLTRLAQQIYQITQELEKNRVERLVMYEDVEKLEREQNETAQLRKPFPKDSLAQLQQKRRQVQIWKAGLSSRNLGADEILKYLVDTALVVSRTVLERKSRLDQAIRHWKGQLAARENGDQMEDVKGGGGGVSGSGGLLVSLGDYYLKRKEEEEGRMSVIQKYWDELGRLFFEWVQSPSHLISLMEVIKGETDLTIQYAQQNFTKLSELRKLYDERKPQREEYSQMFNEKQELLNANKTLRSSELERFEQLCHLTFVWGREASYLRLEPRQIVSLNKSTSELLLRAIFAKISKLNETVQQLGLLIQQQSSSEEGGQQDTSMVSVEYKLLSSEERQSLLQTSEKELKEAIKVLNEQLEACFPYMTEPEHLIHTARMCKNAGQLDSTLMVCQRAIQTITEMEEKREEYASTFRRLYVLEMEKFFGSEFRISFNQKKRLEEFQKEVESLEAQDLALYQGKKGKSSFGGQYSRKRGYQTHDLRYAPLTLATASNFQYSHPSYVSNFYSFLESIAQQQELTPENLHLRIGRYAQVNTDSQNFPEDRGAPFVHSDFVKNLNEICGLMIRTVVEKRNRLRDEVAEQRKFEKSVDEEGFASQMKSFNKEILEMFEKCCEHVQDHTMLNSLVRELLNFEGDYSVFRLNVDDFDLSLPICEMFLKKVLEEGKEIREYENQLLQYIKLLSEEETLNSQRKELEGAQFKELQELRSVFAELMTFLPCHRMSLNHYQTLAYNLANELVMYLLNYKRQKEQELEAMVRQPRLVRGHSMGEEEIKKEFEDNQDQQEKLNLVVVELVLKFVEKPQQLVQLGEELLTEKEFKDVIKVTGKAQDMYKLRLADRLRYEALMKQVLDQSRAQLVPGAGVSDDVQEILEELEGIRHNLKEPVEQLRQTILQLADNLISAAQPEERDDVIEAQSILVFKMSMSEEKFEEVHTLVGDEKWEKEVRDDLLNYVHAYDPTLPGSPIQMLQKIDLLLREGWWKEALEHRPEPSAADASQSIEVLKRLWSAVEKHSPNDLDQLVETIEAFTIKEFQKFNANTLDPLLDVMQTRYPRVIFELYSKGSEIMMTNSSNKKYKMYVDFLTAMKTRLLTVGLVSEWNDFIAKVRKKEIRKKNLINMLNVADL